MCSLAHPGYLLGGVACDVPMVLAPGIGLTGWQGNEERTDISTEKLGLGGLDSDGEVAVPRNHNVFIVLNREAELLHTAEQRDRFSSSW